MKTFNHNINIFGPGDCLSRQAIEYFIENKLSEQERKQVLSHARKCELCSEALEGANYFKSADQFRQSLDKMHHSPWRRSLNSSFKSRKLFSGISSIAASIALLFGLYYIFEMKDVFDRNISLLEKTEISSTNHNSTLEPVKSIILTDSLQDESKPVERKKESEKVLYPPKMNTTVVTDKEVLTIHEADIELEEIDIPELTISKAISSQSEAQFNNSEESVQEGNETDFAFLGQNEQKTDSEEKTKKRTISSRKESKVETTENVYYVAEVKPMFNGGGVDNFNKFISDSLKVVLPDSVWNQTIIVSFRISASGKIESVKLLNGTTSKVLNKRIVEIVENSPAWVPAYISGSPVAVDQQIEIVLNQR